MLKRDKIRHLIIYVYKGLTKLFPILFAILSKLKEITEASFYYWLYNDVDLNLVCSTVIPTDEMLNDLEHYHLKLDDYWKSDDYSYSYRPLFEICKAHGVDES